MTKIYTAFFLSLLALFIFVHKTYAKGTTSRLYIPIANQTTLLKENGSQELMIKDYLNSTRTVDGTTQESQTYYPYGDSSEGEPLKATDKQFTGHRKLAETGVYHAGARFYNPQLGMFTQADTVEGPNRYGYATNNPISNFDPDGHQSITGFIDDAARSLAEAATKAESAGLFTQARTFVAKLLSREAVATVEGMPVKLARGTRVTKVPDLESVWSGVELTSRGKPVYRKLAKYATSPVVDGQYLPGGGLGEFNVLRMLHEAAPESVAKPHGILTHSGEVVGYDAEFISGHTVKERYLGVPENQHIPRGIFEQARDFISLIHGRGLAHGDFNANNMIVDYDGKLTFFDPVAYDPTDLGLIRKLQESDLQWLDELRKLVK